MIRTGSWPSCPSKVYVTTAWTNLLQDALRNRPEPREPTTMVFRWKDAT